MKITLYFLFIFILYSCPQQAASQSLPFRIAFVETTLSIQPNFQDDLNGSSEVFWENWAAINLLTNLSNHWRIGLHYNYIWTKFQQIHDENFFLMGLTIRHEYQIIPKVNFYGQFSISSGNMCTCDNIKPITSFPYKQENLWYVGGGIGIQYEFYKKIHFNLGINDYTIVNSKLKTEHLPQPFIGLMFRLN